MGTKRNLWNETLNELSKRNLSWDNVEEIHLSPLICEQKVKITKERFEELAKKTEYDSGYGSEEVNTTLEILLDDGSWMTRSSYDGMEWWETHVRPKTISGDFGNIDSLLDKDRWDGGIDERKETVEKDDEDDKETSN